MSLTIADVYGREVLDSRGNPTLEVELKLSDGSAASAIVPSGASKGQHEALELRDGDKKRFLGKGVLTAVAHVNDTLKPALVGKAFAEPAQLDKLLLALDGTPQKSKLGANTILGVSLAFAKALAVSEKRPLWVSLNERMGTEASLPVPLMNILNGGEHANNGLEIQEFMIVPHGFGSFSDALRAGCEVFHHLKNELHHRGLSTAVGDEGGFAPDLKTTTETLELVLQSVQKAGYQPGKQISLALDVASSSFFQNDKYQIRVGDKTQLDSQGLIAFYAELAEKFPLVSIEDGLDENDWSGWKKLTALLGSRMQLVGDDLFVTQAAYVQKGIDEKAANSVLIKVNQVGSLTETLDTMALCRKNGYRTVVSHRSGETEDTTIAHLAVASGSGQIKTGSASRGERTAKYNELLRIEDWAARNGRKLAFKDAFAR